MIDEMYLDALGRPMPRYVAQEIIAFLDAGIQPDMICAILAYTGGAPRPSWVYARTVIERQAAQGAKTAADFHGNVEKWRTTKTAGRAKTVLEQQYQQREYGSEYNEMPPEQLEEMRRI